MKSKGTAAVLAFLLGCWGVHHFYLGNTGRGILYLVIGFFGFFFVFPFFITGIFSLIDFISILCMSEESFNKKYNHDMMTRLYQASQQPQHASQPTAPAPIKEQTTKVDSFDVKTEKLKQLKELLDSNTITQEEFDTLKQDILNK